MLGCCWWSVWPGPPPALEMLTKARRWKVPGATPVNVCSSRSIMLRTQGQTKIIINLCFWAVSYAAERPHRNSFALIIGYQNHKLVTKPRSPLSFFAAMSIGTPPGHWWELGGEMLAVIYIYIYVCLFVFVCVCVYVSMFVRDGHFVIWANHYRLPSTCVGVKPPPRTVKLCAPKVPIFMSSCVRFRNAV